MSYYQVEKAYGYCDFASKEPGFINIGWNYYECQYEDIGLSYSMMNEPIFIFGSVTPVTFDQKYVVEKCGDGLIVTWEIFDSDPINNYYITVGAYGKTFPDTFNPKRFVEIRNRTSNPMMVHFYRSDKTNFVYELQVDETQDFIINGDWK